MEQKTFDLASDCYRSNVGTRDNIEFYESHPNFAVLNILIEYGAQNLLVK
jgi:hypothetical protein